MHPAAKLAVWLYEGSNSTYAKAGLPKVTAVTASDAIRADLVRQDPGEDRHGTQRDRDGRVHHGCVRPFPLPEEEAE
jgi:hypothetical protein